MKINEYLLQFLSEGNKEAAIPGLGVFYTDLHNTVSFREVTPSDRAFIEYVAQKSGVDEIAVSSSIDQWVKLILQDLKTSGRSVLTQIGTFEVTSNTVVFTPEVPEIPVAKVDTVVPLKIDEDDDLPAEKPADTFGMEDEENDPYAPKYIPEDGQEENSFLGNKNIWWMVAISVVVLAIIIVFLIPSTRQKVLSIIPGGDNGQVTEIVLGAENAIGDNAAMAEEDVVIEEEVIKGEKERIEAVSEKIVVDKPAAQQPTAKPAEKPATKPATKPVAKQTTKPTTKPATSTKVASSGKTSGKYNVIAGTYKDRLNAESEVARFRNSGFNNVRIVPKDGFYYVSLSSFATKDEAIAYKLKLSDKNVQGWIKEL